jgi:site-specific DNA-methyltransferase (adenine-specific)
MKDIPDGSVDLVLTDPPYNIGKAKWDKIPDYINWCGKWIKECERVLKDNGSFYFWHNDMAQIAQLMEWIRQNTKFVYNSFCIWDKGDFRALAWKNPSEDNNLRSWFNTCEYCLFYTFQDETGLTTVMLDTNNFPTMRRYFKGLREYTGLNKKQILERIGQNADHCFRWNSSQWDMPTPETYKQLIDTFGIDKWDGFREYEDLRREYEDLRYTHNLDANHNNVWKSTERNNGKQHPTQKPLDLMERIVKTSSKEDGVILDPFMGSGSTGVACINTGRNFIGIELDEGYFNIAQKRIQAAQRR